MTIRTTLFAAIAGLAAAAVLSFGAVAQENFPAPATRTTAQSGEMMSSGPNSWPVMRRTAMHHRHTIRVASHDSTPAEKAATERLNQQQLAGRGAAL
jgi:hypothetical protein